MRKSFRPIAVGLMAAALTAGQPLTALAEQGYVNSGPGAALDNEQTVSLESPSGVVTQTEPSPAPSGPSSDTAQTSPSSSVPEQTDTTQTNTSQTGTSAAETTESRIPAENEASFQFQLLRQDLTWTDAVRSDALTSAGESGFLSISAYINNLPGDILYRTYTSTAGWSNWAMNGGHTSWNQGVPVEAVQFRLNGIFGDQFDLYYSTLLSDGTQCGWSKNGGSNGAMGTGQYIVGLRLSIWGKSVAGASYDMNAPLSAATADGIQFVDGTPVYSSGTGQPFTGWAWNDRDRYYFVNNIAATGWQYIDGYKYFFEADGKLVTDLEPYLGSQGPFMIRINKAMNCTTVYIKDGDNGFIIPYKAFLCSTGDDTPLGDHKTPEKYRWRLMVTDEYCQYLTRLGPGLPILLHSVIYETANPYTLKADTYNWLGATKSHGCIRYTTADARWIYENCALGTTVNVYESDVPGPFDRPALKVMIPSTQKYDPTDANLAENQ